MSISPASDIVLDVARAANPQTVAAASQRLQRIAAESAVADFPSTLQATAGFASARSPSSLRTRLATPAVGARAGRAAGLDAYQSLGGLVLQQAIEKMMPAQSATMFGAGAGGSFWKSALAEHMANAVAASVFKWPAHAGSPQGSATQVAATSVPGVAA